MMPNGPARPLEEWSADELWRLHGALPGYQSRLRARRADLETRRRTVAREVAELHHSCAALVMRAAQPSASDRQTLAIREMALETLDREVAKVRADSAAATAMDDSVARELTKRMGGA